MASSFIVAHSDRRWCVLHTRARHEKKVCLACQSQGIPCYLPLRTHRTFSGGKVNTFLLPVFPGYVFAALGQNDFSSLKRTQSVAQRLDPPNQKQFIIEMNRVYQVEQTGMQIECAETLSMGQAVMVKSGPLSGLIGKVVRYKNRTRLQIEIAAIQKGILIEISRKNLVTMNEV